MNHDQTNTNTNKAAPHSLVSPHGCDRWRWWHGAAPANLQVRPRKSDRRSIEGSGSPPITKKTPTQMLFAAKIAKLALR